MLTVHASSGMQDDGDAHTRKMELALYDMAFDVASTFVNGESTLFMLVWDAVEPTKNALDARGLIIETFFFFLWRRCRHPWRLLALSGAPSLGCRSR